MDASQGCRCSVWILHFSTRLLFQRNQVMNRPPREMDGAAVRAWARSGSTPFGRVRYETGGPCDGFDVVIRTFV